LADACHYSWRRFRIRDLVDRAHPASGTLAEAVRCRSSSSNSAAALIREGIISIEEKIAGDTPASRVGA
jgi:hypothetical protein